MRISFLLLTLVATAAAGVSQAQSVKKCVDADGNITFMQGDCPKSADQQNVTIHQENRNPHGELRFPEATNGLEWVWVASVLDDNSGGVVVRESGDSYLVQQAYGCSSLWRYEESFVQVFSPGPFGETETQLLLPDHQQRCLLLSVNPIQGNVDLSEIPRVSPPPLPAAIAGEEPRPGPREPRYQQPKADDEEACRRLRRRHRDLNQRCRGLEECDKKRVAIEALQRQWESRGCEGALGIGPY